MAVRGVFVIWTNPLFHESTVLLLKHPDIIILGATADFMIAHEDISRPQPDTILFEKPSRGLPADIIGILQMEAWNIRIIGLSLDTNEMSNITVTTRQ